MLTVTVTVIYNDCLAKAIMDYNEELQFSLMKLVEIRRINPR